LPAADWLDLIHHHLTENVAQEQREALDRQLTGPLDTYIATTEPQPPKLRPPSWVRLSQADIDRMNQHRT
jgi:hypothetical protein